MSLVTTAMLISSRRRLHRASTSAVLPEPTGPAMPRRRGWGLWFMVGAPGSRPEEARVLGLVVRAGDGVRRRGGGDVIVEHRQRARDDGGDARADLQQDALAGALAEGHQAHGGAGLRLDPGKGEA